MYITFNCLNTGLGNNGGSRTILYCQEVLKKLGYKCDVAATSDKFTWFKHPNTIPTLPKADWIIATSCTSVSSTIAHRYGKKAWYIRAHETWNPQFNNEEKMDRLYKDAKKFGVHFIVNSIWLQKYLENIGIQSHLIYQGIDINLWNDSHLRDKENKTVIGCLYTPQPRKMWCNFKALSNVLGTKRYKYIAYGNKMIPKEQHEFISEYLVQPSIQDLNKLYSKCHIWFAPTNSEGLHNPPMEAALCGAILCHSNSERNGMIDYTQYNNSLQYEDNDINQAAKMIKELSVTFNIKEAFVDKTKNIIKSVIGSREVNMHKLATLLGTL